jgi:outer membrane lipoprotein LolB
VSARSIALAVLAVLLLAACSAAPRRIAADAPLLAAQAERERQLAVATRWQLQGKVAVRSGTEGGSGQLQWSESGDSGVLELRAPISGQGWRLQIEADGAVLDGLEGGPRRDRDAARLLREAVGWEIPVDAMRHWVRGARADGAARLEFADDGLPARLQQAGWTIDYLDWQRELSPPLPRRLVVGQWETLP